MPDVLVIGAGIAGAAMAFGAARRGATVTVVDDRRVGRATAAGAGIIAPWATSLTGDVYDLYAAGADDYPSILGALAEIGIADTGYARNGALVLAHDDEAVATTFARLSARTERSNVAGRPDVLDADAVRRMFPPLRPVMHGIHVPGGARVDGRRLTAALLDGVRHHGGAVGTGTVTGSGPDILIDGELPSADVVVIAAGAWSPPLAAPGRIRVEPQRGQICHLHLSDADTGRWPSVLPPDDHYIVPFDHGRVIVGATREVGVGDARITAEGVRQVLTQAIDLAPGLGSASLVETRVGLRPFPSVDHRPTIGSLDERTWVVTGFGAIGLTIGPTVGDRLAIVMLGGGPDPLLTPFAPI